MCTPSPVHPRKRVLLPRVLCCSNTCRGCCETGGTKAFKIYEAFSSLFIFSGNRCHPVGGPRISFIRKEKGMRAVLLPNMWESLNLTFHPRCSQTPAHCSVRGASHTRIGPAFRSAESHSVFLGENQTLCSFGF